jgi:hypothetical protein
MGEILQFRPRGNEGDMVTTTLVDQALTDIAADEDESKEKDLVLEQVTIPSSEELFNDGVVVYEGRSLYNWRAHLDIETEEGRKKMLEIEDIVLMARTVYIERHVPDRLKPQAYVALAKECYKVGLQFDSQEHRENALILLNKFIPTPDGVVIIINNLKIKNEAHSRSNRGGLRLIPK